MPYLKEAALCEDVANELIQVHQTLVVPDMMGKNRQHHSMLWRTERIGKKAIDKGSFGGEMWKGERNMKSVRRIMPYMKKKRVREAC